MLLIEYITLIQFSFLHFNVVLLNMNTLEVAQPTEFGYFQQVQ